MFAEQPAGHVTTPIMPARPLCFGSLLSEEGYPACLVCMCDHECASTAANWWWKTHRYAYLAQPLIRVYARENHELRERVEAMEGIVAAARALEINGDGFMLAKAGTLARLRTALRTLGALAHALKEAGI